MPSFSGIHNGAGRGEFTNVEGPLRFYSAHYEGLRSRLPKVRRARPHRLLYAVFEAAAFAAGHHSGRFADGALESVLLDVGGDLRRVDSPPRLIASPDVRSGRFRVLHVASTIYGVGGHTRMISHWIKSDPGTCHSVVLTDQGHHPIPSWLVRSVRENGGGFAGLPARADTLLRAAWLRALSRSWADVVILHHAGTDVVPTIAYATEGGPPVCVLNHADHVFWLGSSVADSVIDLRDVGARTTRDRRFVPRIAMLPIPLTPPSKPMGRAAARDSLGIATDQLMFLSVGRAAKFRPTRTHNFFATMHKVLTAVPAAHLYVVGVTPSEAASANSAACHERMHFCGEIADPSPFRASADIYVDAFPWGSATSTFEAALAGLPVVLPYPPLVGLLSTNHGLEGVVAQPGSESEYVELLQKLAEDPAARNDLAAGVRDHVQSHHTGDAWLGHLRHMYNQVTDLPHKPHDVPVTSCTNSDVDRAISAWQSEAPVQQDVLRECRDSMRHLHVRYARGLCASGNYLEAVSLLASGVRSWGCDATTARAIARIPVKSILGR